MRYVSPYRKVKPFLVKILLHTSMGIRRGATILILSDRYSAEYEHRKDAKYLALQNASKRVLYVIFPLQINDLLFKMTFFRLYL